MAVGENGVTLHDLERTMLSLDRDKNLNDGDREFLMKGYKEERMRYMDSLFAFTEEHRRRLEAGRGQDDPAGGAEEKTRRSVR